MIWGSGADICPLSAFTTSFRQGAIVQSRKWPYLSPWAPNQKTKGTFFSPTLKVEEKKVPLLFRFEAQGLRYGHFLLFTIAHWRNNVGKSENGYISAPEPQIKKLKTFSFLQLCKLKKRNCLYLIILILPIMLGKVYAYICLYYLDK